MERIIDAIYNNIEYFLLILLRVSALIISSPIFGRRALPNTLKIAFCLVLSWFVTLAFPPAAKIEYRSVLEFALLCIKELLFGLVLGYVTTLFFSVPQTAGYVIDMQLGFGMVNIFDVQNNISVPVTGNFLYVITMLCFFAVNGHLQLVYILTSTFKSIPPGQAQLNAALGYSALEVFAQSFVMAANVAMPLIAAGIMGEVIMGIIVRTTPQMNMFVVGIPLKIILGVMALILLLPAYVRYTDTIFAKMLASIHYMLGGLAAKA